MLLGLLVALYATHKSFPWRLHGLSQRVLLPGSDNKYAFL